MYNYPWALPVGLFLASFGWWESFVSEKAKVSIAMGLQNDFNIASSTLVACFFREDYW